MDGGVIQISRRFYFQLFLFVDKHPPSIFTLRDFVAAIAGPFLRRGFRPQRRLLICRQTSTVHLYSSRLRRRYRRSILTAVMLGSVLHCYRVPGIRWHNNRRLALWSRWNVVGLQLLLYGLFSSLWEITLHCYERLQINVTRDYASLLWEITLHCYERFPLVFQLYNPPSIFTVGMIWRRILSTFPFSTVLFGWQTSSVHLYSSRLRRRFRRSIPTALMRPSFFYTLDSVITRDYTSTLREITLQCYERLRFIVMRDYKSSLREIPFSISIIQPAVYICYTLNDSYIYYWLLLCSRIFYHTTFFMMFAISLFTNKIETHFYPSYLSHHRVSNVIRLVLTWLYCSSSCKTGVAQWQSAGHFVF